LTIRRIEIHSKPDPTFGSVWGGRCVEAGWGWTSTNDTTAEEDLRRARFIVAGLTGEVLAKLDTPGSSIDEERLSRELGVNAALKLRDPALSQAEYVTFAINLCDQRVWRVAEAILRANWDILNQLAVHLDQHEQVKGNQLQKLLANVRKIAS
jgi:hypothetical protein